MGVGQRFNNSFDIVAVYGGTWGPLDSEIHRNVMYLRNNLQSHSVAM